MATKAKGGNKAPRPLPKAGAKRGTQSRLTTPRPRGGAAGGRGY